MSLGPWIYFLNWQRHLHRCLTSVFHSSLCIVKTNYFINKNCCSEISRLWRRFSVKLMNLKNNEIIFHFSKIEFIFPVAISGPPVAKCFVCSNTGAGDFPLWGWGSYSHLYGGWLVQVKIKLNQSSWRWNSDWAWQYRNIVTRQHGWWSLCTFPVLASNNGYNLASCVL